MHIRSEFVTKLECLLVCLLMTVRRAKYILDASDCLVAKELNLSFVEPMREKNFSRRAYFL